MEDNKTTMQEMNESTAKCPFGHGAIKQVAGNAPRNLDWWPNQLKLSILRQHSTLSNPMAGNLYVCDGLGFRSCVLSHMAKRIIETKLQINTSPQAVISTLLCAGTQSSIFCLVCLSKIV